MSLYPRIKATWDRKKMRQKMHYSEPCPEAITGRQRRKHNPRPITLPPCSDDMDLMLEAKDKEQAVFELMRTLKLPGWDTFNNIIPYERDDDNKPAPKKAKKKKTKKQIAAEVEEFGKELSEEEEAAKEIVPEEEIGMGGKENRVYWPAGMEEWLRPKKREVKKKSSDDEEAMFKNPTPANFAARKVITERNRAPLSEDTKERLQAANSLADLKKIMEEAKESRTKEQEEEVEEATKPVKKAPAAAKKATPKKKKRMAKSVPTPSESNVEDEEEGDDHDEEEEEEDLSMPDLSAEDEVGPSKKVTTATKPERKSVRGAGKRKSYAEVDVDED